MLDWSITRNWLAVKDVICSQMFKSISGNRVREAVGGLDRVRGQRFKEVVSQKEWCE